MDFLCLITRVYHVECITELTCKGIYKYGDSIHHRDEKQKGSHFHLPWSKQTDSYTQMNYKTCWWAIFQVFYHIIHTIVDLTKKCLPFSRMASKSNLSSFSNFLTILLLSVIFISIRLQPQECVFKSIHNTFK